MIAMRPVAAPPCIFAISAAKLTCPSIVRPRAEDDGGGSDDLGCTDGACRRSDGRVERLVEREQPLADIIAAGFDKDVVARIDRLLNIAEYARVFGPVDDCAWRHNGSDISLRESFPRQIRHRDHAFNGIFAFSAHVFYFGRYHFKFFRFGQIIKRSYNIPAIHLPLVDGLRTVIDAGGIT